MKRWFIMHNLGLNPYWVGEFLVVRGRMEGGGGGGGGGEGMGYWVTQ